MGSTRQVALSGRHRKAILTLVGRVRWAASAHHLSVVSRSTTCCARSSLSSKVLHRYLSRRAVTMSTPTSRLAKPPTSISTLRAPSLLKDRWKTRKSAEKMKYSGRHRLCCAKSSLKGKVKLHQQRLRHSATVARCTMISSM